MASKFNARQEASGVSPQAHCDQRVSETYEKLWQRWDGSATIAFIRTPDPRTADCRASSSRRVEASGDVVEAASRGWVAGGFANVKFKGDVPSGAEDPEARIHRGRWSGAMKLNLVFSALSRYRGLNRSFGEQAGLHRNSQPAPARWRTSVAQGLREFFDLPACTCLGDPVPGHADPHFLCVVRCLAGVTSRPCFEPGDPADLGSAITPRCSAHVQQSDRKDIPLRFPHASLARHAALGGPGAPQQVFWPWSS